MNENLSNMHDAHKQVRPRAIIVTVIIFTLLVAGMFGFAYLKKQEQVQEIEPVADEPVEDLGRLSYIDRIDATHYFIDGVHTLVGEIPMPTPCDLLDNRVAIAESYPEQVSIDFFVINNAEVCAQVITPARFKVEATVAPEATWRATLDGRPVELNLIPAPEGETPDEFEIFVKG